MKKVLSVIAFVICIVAVKAQGTLQFSQVKLVTTSQTVPSGKVWKVESVLSSEVRYPSSNSNTTLPSNSRIVVVNGTNIAVREEFVNATGLGFNGCCGGGFWMNSTGNSINSTTATLVQVSADNTKLPFWLPAGTTLAAGTNVQYISVIEFDVIP